MPFNERDLSDYVDVAQRIADFREQWPEGSLRPWNPAEPFRFMQAQGFNKDGSVEQQSFIVVVAAAYRHGLDDNPGIGMAWEVFPGRTPYTRGSELQNAETSAWGRAIIAVGASDSKRGIASREEVRNRRAERESEHNHPTAGMDVLMAGCPACMAGMPRNRDGSLSRSRTTDEEKAAAGVMTSGQHAEHTQLAKLARSAPAERMTGLICQNTSHDRYGIEGCTECDPWLDQPAGLSVVGDPEDRPGSIGRDQQREMHALFGQLGVKDRTVRLATCAKVLDLPGLKSSSDLSYRQAGDLLLALREQAKAEASG